MLLPKEPKLNYFFLYWMPLSVLKCSSQRSSKDRLLLIQFYYSRKQLYQKKLRLLEEAQCFSLHLHLHLAANILMDSLCLNIKLADFGSSVDLNFVESGGPSRLRGTLAFMAPEVRKVMLEVFSYQSYYVILYNNLT